MENKEIKETFYGVDIGRVSTVKQDVFGDSLEDQETQTEQARLRASVQFKCNIKIIKTFPFAESASVALDLQPMQKVLDYVRQHNRENKTPIRFAFIKCIDRITRAGATVYGQLMAEFAKEGVTVVDTYGVINPTKVNTLEHLGIEYPWSVFKPSFVNELLDAESAKKEVRDGQTRMIGAAIRYVRLGYWRGSNPLGFTAVKRETEHGKRFVLNPHTDESKWFTRMFELRAEGVFNDEEIVNEVNKIGFLSRKRFYRTDKENRSKITKIGGQKILTVKMLRTYIQNPIYAGVNTEKWLFFDGKLHPVYLKEGGIISVELFNKANHGKVTILNDESGQPQVYKGEIPSWQQTKLKLNSDTPYKQYVLCPLCSHHLKGSFSRGKSGGRFLYYHCHLGHKYWAVSGKTMDETITAFVKNVRFSKKFIYNFEKKFLIAWNSKLDQLSRNTIDWNRRINELRDAELILKDKLKFATTPTGFQVIEEELTKVGSEIAQATIKRNKTEDEEIDVKTLVNAAKYWMEHFDFLLLETKNQLHKATLFGKIFEELPTFEELKDGTPKLSSLFELNKDFNKGQNLLSGIDGSRTHLYSVTGSYSSR
jgi:site-specific DNA recombinase